MNKLPGLVGTMADDSDIVRFWPVALGETTDGFFELYFDGSNVDLKAGGEDIDAISLADNGDLLLSTMSNGKVGALSFADEDIMRFAPTALGGDTAGSWSLYFDGSDVDGELSDVTAVSVDPTSGAIDFTVEKRWVFGGFTAEPYDVIRCEPDTLGATTACASLESVLAGR